MHKIDTHIDRIIVEIEGREYALAEKTAEVAEALIDARRKHRDDPEYKLWRAELKILLGKRALRRLFPSGKAENLDRMHRIHAGVLRAFETNAEVLESEQLLTALLHSYPQEGDALHRGDVRRVKGR